MPRDYIDIGSAPSDEDCAQVGSPNYESRAREECTRFLQLIRQVLGPEPEGARLAVKSNPHDFGTYYSVCCWFELGDEAATKYAYRCEREAPRTWDQTPATPVADSSNGNHGVCDSCLAAAASFVSGDRADLALVMTELGADVADHLCDVVEAPNVVKSCACACRRR